MPKLNILVFCLSLLLVWTNAQDSGQQESDSLRVTTIYNRPWIFPVNQSDDNNPGAKQHAGLLVDLFELIASDIGLNYSINSVKDGAYGKVNNATGQWSGMIGELMRGEADIALADMTITRSRSEVIDFGHPFMATGISILAKRPPYYLSNNETNSKGPMVFYPVNSVQDLLNQDHVQYGAIPHGSTLSFFKKSSNPLYSSIGDKLEAQDNDSPKNYAEARTRVGQGNGQYVFFMEEASIRYTKGISCEFTELGTPLNSQSYAMGFAKGSKLLKNIDIVLLRLIEQGSVESLINKWFPPRLECNQSKPSDAYMKAALDLVLKAYN